VNTAKYSENVQSLLHRTDVKGFPKQLNIALVLVIYRFNFANHPTLRDNYENINLYISSEEIFDCIKKLKNDKASGEGGIINEYIKSGLIKSTAHQCTASGAAFKYFKNSNNFDVLT
jgi:hypothetical protein